MTDSGPPSRDDPIREIFMAKLAKTQSAQLLLRARSTPIEKRIRPGGFEKKLSGDLPSERS